MLDQLRMQMSTHLCSLSFTVAPVKKRHNFSMLYYVEASEIVAIVFTSSRCAPISLRRSHLPKCGRGAEKTQQEERNLPRIQVNLPRIPEFVRDQLIAFYWRECETVCMRKFSEFGEMPYISMRTSYGSSLGSGVKPPRCCKSSVTFTFMMLLITGNYRSTKKGRSSLEQVQSAKDLHRTTDVPYCWLKWN